MNIENIEQGIEKTGYRLEFNISRTLADNGWNVINNKYYVDDQQETVREIDIVAYKATQIGDTYVYTALIISCKKNEKNAWALLSKPPDYKDPNMEWNPVHAWSNHKVLELMLSEKDWKDNYISNLKGCDGGIVSSLPQKHIFGFQEVNMESGAPQNDKNIFNSITSLMKAQAYEMNALPVRKKESCVFQFNLLSLAKTELVRLDFSVEKTKGVAVCEEVYVAGYIVNKEQTFAKVHFIDADVFTKTIGKYNELHKANVNAFSALCEKFYKEFVDDFKKLNLYKEEISFILWWPLKTTLKRHGDSLTLLKEGWISWNEEDGYVEFQLDLDEASLYELNANQDIRKKLALAFDQYYKYKGGSRFALCDIPF